MSRTARFPVTAPRDTIRRDFPTALVVPVLIAALLFDGVLSRIEGLLLLALFAGWPVAVLYAARRQRSLPVEVIGAQRPLAAVLQGVAGLALLILAGRLIVSGASAIATAYAGLRSRRCVAALARSGGS